MIDSINSEYFVLKLIIALMLLTLIIIITSLFYRLHLDKKLKNRKQVLNSKIVRLLGIYFGESKESKDEVLHEMRKCFIKDKVFRDVMIIELRKRIENDNSNKQYKELYVELGGMETVNHQLLSKNPLNIYKGLLDVDFFRLYPSKELMLRLQNHNDKRIKMLVSAILFRYNNEINANDILALEPILSPIVEIKIYDELNRRAVSCSQKEHVCNIIRECLESETSDKMRAFLIKSSELICNPLKLK